MWINVGQDSTYKERLTNYCFFLILKFRTLKRKKVYFFRHSNTNNGLEKSVLKLSEKKSAPKFDF